MEKEYICKRLKLKQWLCKEKNIYPIRMIPSLEKDDFINWVYKWDIELDNAISEYFSKDLWKVV